MSNLLKCVGHGIIFRDHTNLLSYKNKLFLNCDKVHRLLSLGGVS